MNNYGLPVKIGYEPETYVQIGEVKFNRFAQFINTKEILKAANVMDEIRSEVMTNLPNSPRGKYDAANYTKTFNKAIFNKLRTSQAKFKKLVNAKFYEAFVKPIPNDIRLKFCFGANRNISRNKLEAVTSNLALIKQAISDNNVNIIPFILLFEKDTSELKSLLGSFVWKTLCKNSLSRNKMLADYVKRHVGHKKENLKAETLKDIINVPTTLLGTWNINVDPKCLIFLSLNCKGSWSKRKTLEPVVQLYYDTDRLLNNDKDIFKWSLRRLREEHETIVRKAMAAEYSTAMFEWADKLNIGEFGYKGYTVRPLLSAFEIGVEGTSMRHCAGGYATHSAQGRYLVFSVCKGIEKYSTIGMYMNDDMTVRFQQQYRAFNAELPGDDPAKEIPSFIESVLNIN